MRGRKRSLYCVVIIIILHAYVYVLCDYTTACLVRLTRMLYSYCFVRCYFQDLFETSCSLLVKILSSFYLRPVFHPYCMNTATHWKKSRFTLLDRSYFLMIDSLSIAFHMSAMCMLTVNEILPPSYVKYFH